MKEVKNRKKEITLESNEDKKNREIEETIKSGSFKKRKNLYVKYVSSRQMPGDNYINNKQLEALINSFKTKNEQEKIFEIEEANKRLEIQMLNVFNSYLESRICLSDLKSGLVTLNTIQKMERIINNILKSIENKEDRLKKAKESVKNELISSIDVSFEFTEDGFIRLYTGYNNENGKEFRVYDKKNIKDFKRLKLSEWISLLTDLLVNSTKEFLARRKVLIESMNEYDFCFNHLVKRLRIITEDVIKNPSFPIKKKEIEPIIIEKGLIPKFKIDDIDEKEYKLFKEGAN